MRGALPAWWPARRAPDFIVAFSASDLSTSETLPCSACPRRSVPVSVRVEHLADAAVDVQDEVRLIECASARLSTRVVPTGGGARSGERLREGDAP